MFEIHNSNCAAWLRYKMSVNFDYGVTTIEPPIPVVTSVSAKVPVLFMTKAAVFTVDEESTI